MLTFVSAAAQVVPPAEIKDPELRAVEEHDLDALKQLGTDIQAPPTEYHFYLSRKLDLEVTVDTNARPPLVCTRLSNR